MNLVWCTASDMPCSALSRSAMWASRMLAFCLAIVEEPSYLTVYICKPRGEPAPLEHLMVGGIQETKAADAFMHIAHAFPLSSA